MQEHIKKLAGESGAVFDVLAMGRCDGVVFTPAELERFAQAVARDCADIAYGSSRADDMPLNYRTFHRRAGDEISARFGLAAPHGDG